MTITIQLAGPGFERLRAEAEELGLSVEQLAQAIVERYVLRPRGDTPSDVVDDETFQRVKAETFRENEELYRRLAK
jgi:hypothetical protein